MPHFLVPVRTAYHEKKYMTNDQAKTNSEQIKEISAFKQIVHELEQSESKCKRVEEALQKSEEKFLELLEHINDIFYELDKQGIIQYCSPSVERLLGYYQAEIIGRSISDFLDTEDTLSAIENIQKVMVGHTAPHEYRIRCKSGEIRWIRVYSNPVRKGDQIVGIRGVMSDITERKQVEQELKEKTVIAQTFMDALPCVALMLRPQTREIVALNKTAKDAGAMLGSTCFGSWLQIDKACHSCRAPELWKTGKAQALEIESTGRYLEIHWVPVSEDLYLHYALDVTERKNMEETLRESELRYRELFDNISSGVAIYEVKADGNDFILKDFNKAGERLDGDRKEEIIGKWINQSMPDSKEFGLLNVFKRVWKTGIPEHYPASFYEDERLKKWVENYVYKLPGGDIVAVYDDITDRKQAEEALRESENKYRELSIVDGLTQLYNSRYFYHQLKMEIDRADRYGHPLTLLLLDLDDFKLFNDAYGHIEGDQVLMRLGQVVKKCLRQTDSAYRYGGEEFTILLPMTTSVDGAVTAERIRTEFKKEIFSPVPGQDVHVTVSIGLAQYKLQEDMKAVVHRVDQLMYTAKKDGKDRVCHES